jgi:hypothetical protein
MKSIKQQYIDLTEGKMSQANFMRNVRMTMPQYVTNVTSFGDAVRILKNKGILTEVYEGDGIIKYVESQLNYMVDGDSITFNEFKAAMSYLKDHSEEIVKEFGDNVSLEDATKIAKTIVNTATNQKPEEKDIDESVTTTNTTDGFDSVSEEDGKETSDSDAEFDAILKQLEDQMAGEIAVKSDKLDEPLEEAEGITADAVAVEKAIDNKKIDPAQVKAAAEKAIRGDSTDLALLMVNAGGLFENKEPKAVDENLEEVTLGITTEHECYPDKSYDEIEKMVKKNIKKNPNYYTNYKLTGIRDYEVQTMDPSKPEDHQMKFYTEKTAVDTARGMKKVKMPKVEEKKKLKEQVDEKMRFQDLPADPEKYKMVKDSKGKIIKATNAEGNEFQRGDETTAFDGEKIKIEKFEESQGKIKAIYNTGMFYRAIDIDGLNPVKETMRPGVDIGKSFEKFKLKDLEEIIREAVNEYFDGRDNLIDPIAAEEEA